jgi:hypothetical protein
MRNSPDDLRQLGYTVAVHNDYRQHGKSRTFWLMTKGNICVKGEGFTDAEALDEIRSQLGINTCGSCLPFDACKCDGTGKRP